MKPPLPFLFVALPLAVLCSAVAPSAALVAQDDVVETVRPESKPAPKPAPKPQVPVLRLEGSYRDLPEAGAGLMDLLSGGGGKPKSFYGLLTKLNELADEKATTPVLFDLTGAPSMNLAQTAELTRALRALSAKRKTVAYVENASLVEMQVAAACDRVLMADMGMVDLRSPSMNVLFLKDAMDLLGVQMDIVRCGDFKGAVEPYVLSSMSGHLREHYRSMLTTMNDDLCTRLAAGRKTTPQKIRELQGQRLLTAPQAKAAGLVDRLVPWSGAHAALTLDLGTSDLAFVDAGKEKAKKPMNPLTMLTELFAQKREKEIEVDTLAVLHLSGAIVDGEKASPGSIVSGPTVASVRKLAENDAIKGVVVRINSPGGSATASEAILLALRDLSAKKPVVVSMGELAASGGYYVTCFGRPILAEASTITGSIGVFGMKPNAGALMRRVGLRFEQIALDEAASMDAIDQGWNDDAKSRMQAFVDSIYERFIAHVATSRKLDAQDVLPLAGGRVWSGAQAVQNKLVDRIGGLDDALAMVRAEAKLGDDVEVQHLPEPKGLFESLAASFGGEASATLPAAVLPVLREFADLEGAVRFLLDAAKDRTPRVHARLPLTLTVR
jgi:protease-4